MTGRVVATGLKSLARSHAADGLRPCYYAITTKRLDDAITRIRELPPQRQDEAAELLMSLVEQDADSVHLTAEQAAEVHRRLSTPVETLSHAEVRARFLRQT